MLMDIATEEFSQLEIVGVTIQMLLKGVSGELKDAADNSEIMQVMLQKKALYVKQYLPIHSLHSLQLVESLPEIVREFNGVLPM